MGRLPVAPFAAFAVSLILHAVALFALRVELPSETEPSSLIAELRPAPPMSPPLPHPSPAPRAEVQKPEKTSTAKRPTARKPAASSAPTVPAIPDPGTFIAVEEAMPAIADASVLAPADEAETSGATASDVSSERLPPRGRIRFRVDMGDSGFEIGFARQEWEFEAGRYRLRSSVETTGLASLIRSVEIDMESIGQISGDGLRPEAFGVMRSGRKARERALFDWETMKIRVSDDSDHVLAPGTQDMLSFYYQLAFLDIPPGQAGLMPLATGKKYSAYRLENLGDEIIEIPLGVLDTRHLRSPGENVTEIWLAYDYRLLPVKIRHVDNKGKVFVQVAIEILFGP
jgi:hypothetical protein